MKTIGIIPARMAASRFAGKPMAKLLGMPMVGHCYHRTRLAPGIDEVIVATCDEEITDYVRSIGGLAVMTSTSHTRATTRAAEALETFEAETGNRIEIVVMVQGDEPLMPPSAIGQACIPFSDPELQIVNIMSRLHTLEGFIDKNNVKVVVDRNGDALYFSREPIPSPWRGWEHLPRYMQTGVIAFRRDALLGFNRMEEMPLEQYESVDMNRVLETGGRVRMILTDALTIGVDTPEELIEAEQLLKRDPELQRYLTR